MAEKKDEKQAQEESGEAGFVVDAGDENLDERLGVEGATEVRKAAEKRAAEEAEAAEKAAPKP